MEKRLCRNCKADMVNLSRRKKFCNILCAYDYTKRKQRRLGTEYIRKPINEIKSMALRTCLGPLCRGERLFKSSNKHNRLCANCTKHVRGIGENYFTTRRLK